MKFSAYFFVSIFLISGIQLSAQDHLRNAEDIRNEVLDHLHETQTIFSWSSSNANTIWSALIHSDSMAAIGYNESDDVLIEQFNSSRKKLISSSSKQKYMDSLFQVVNNKYSSRFEFEDIFPLGKSENRPYFYMKIWDFDMVQSLLADSNVRYFEPSGFRLEQINPRSNEGCGNNSAVLATIDYDSIAPTAIQSWHHLEHNIDTAWNKSTKGEDIWIAVMDTGVSDINPKLNSEFDEGESAGRSIEKRAFYPPSSPDGWIDNCGHGSAMTGLACAPRGYDDTPAGISYRSNLASYRVSNDVVINTTNEKAALSNALFDAGDSTKIDIISISLGDVFSSGVVADGIEHAFDQGKLIFAAAGTSTSFTNWYGVIFPASMPQTVAVTGVIEGSNFTRCDVCHSGNEVDFVVYMERSASGNTVASLSVDSVNAYFRGYIGGSSAATASMAGIAGLAWGNNLDLDRDQLLNRLIQTASNYPNRDSEYGWGAVDACEAVDSSFLLPCASSLSNSVEMEITNIVFPSTSDTGSEAEWVIKLDNAAKSYYFSVPEGGASGNPNNFIDATVCDDVPIILSIGNTVCGDTSIVLQVETHEDDGAVSDCDYSSTFDDDQTISNEVIGFSQNKFVQNTTNGDFEFTYTLYCTPTLIAGLIDNGSPSCFGEEISFRATPAGESNYEFFLDENENDTLDTGESLQSGLLDTLAISTLHNNDRIGVIVTSANSCTDSSFARVSISAENYVGVNALSGLINEARVFETDGAIESTQVLDTSANIDHDSGIEVSLNAGFEVLVGAVYHAFIDGCNTNSSLKSETRQKKK